MKYKITPNEATILYFVIMGIIIYSLVKLNIL